VVIALQTTVLPGGLVAGGVRKDVGMSRASLDKHPRDVAAMFDDVATKYDVTNDVLSLGQDRLWRRAVLRAVDARAGERVLDIAAGTGTSSEPFADSGVLVVPADFSLGMLRVGARRRPDLGFTAADAMRLPFADASFDAVTMSFGLRNVADPLMALAEFHRVTVPGGRLVVCEFSHPVNRAFRKVYTEYLMRSVPPIARRVSSNPESYVYLAESIQAWPTQREMAERISAAGWEDVEWRNLSGGVVALHRAAKAR
jgi:demethylmenaquinone methyltransferase/2-methoxy-6-polyprenyl-1,4-benzoquinol methylase